MLRRPENVNWGVLEALVRRSLFRHCCPCCYRHFIGHDRLQSRHIGRDTNHVEAHIGILPGLLAARGIDTAFFLGSLGSP